MSDRAAYFREYRASARRAARELSWQVDAECRSRDPEIWFAKEHRGLAVHICRSHCPVLQQCARWTRARGGAPYAVQGGMAWDERGQQVGASWWGNVRCDRCRE